VSRHLRLLAPPPPGLVVASYGGGVNTVASLIVMRRLGVTPTAIVMADPGSERRRTIAYRDEILPPWLDRVGFPRVTVITRAEEGAFRERAWRLETLREECLRIGALPSIAYGWKKCSAKYKAETQRWWVSRQPWALAEWAAGRRLVKAIGYDLDEGRRVRSAFQNDWEEARFVPWYPLYAAGLDRADCEELIAEEGLPSPGKSACTFCPGNKLAEWEELRVEEPAAFAEAVEMSRRAAPNIEEPDVVGLMRCNPHGKRQLHVWADGGYDGCQLGGREDSAPCECAT